MRAMMEPRAAALIDAPIPSTSNSVRSPSCCIAHNRTCSTPTERGRISSRESASACWTLRPRLGWRRSGADALACEQLGGDALGVRFERLRAIGGQGELTGEDVVDAQAQDGPEVWVGIEVTFEIEQRALAHLGADAFGAPEAEGEIMLGAAARLGAPDEPGCAR